MGAIKHTLQSILKLNMSPRQEKFYQWKLDSYKKVKIVPFKKIKQISDEIESWFNDENIIAKQCFANAFDVSTTIPGVNYIEGEIDVFGMPIEHAWNEYKGKHFDLTSEFALHGKTPVKEYVMYQKFSSKEIWKYAEKAMHKGPFIPLYYKDQLKEHKYTTPSYNTFLNERKNFYTDLSFVSKELNKVKDEIVDKDLGNLEIERILDKAFYPYNVSFENGWGESAFNSMSRVALISAATENSADIIIYYADHFYETFEDDEYWDEFVSVVRRLLRHEFIHHQQIKNIAVGKTSYQLQQILNKSGVEPGKQYDYLWSKYEIQAFAAEAVEELRNVGYTDEEIINKIRTRKDLEESDILFMYMELFNAPDSLYDKKDKRDIKEMKHNKTVLNRLFKEMYTYIKSKK